jgi:hypothetical protein
VEKPCNPFSGDSDWRAGAGFAFQRSPVRHPWSHIEELVDRGEILIGRKHPIGIVAVASDRNRTLAMLVRGHGETLAQLLTRLDEAIAKAVNEGIYTDEINLES